MPPIYFDRPAYLGLDLHPHWHQLLEEGTERYGSHFAGSRLAAYCPLVYTELEQEWARSAGAPDAITMSSGSLLATTTLRVLRQAGYAVFIGPLTHSAWTQESTRAGDEQLQICASQSAWQIAAQAAVARDEQVALITDRCCAIRCVAANVAWLASLNQSVLLVIDDSHAAGVLDAGRGSYSWAKRQLPDSVRVLSCASLGKAFSMPGAIVCGDEALVAAIRASPSFGGASPFPPAYAWSLLQAWDTRPKGTGPSLIEQQRTALARNVQVVESLGLVGPHVPGHPAFCVTAAEQINAFKQAGAVLSAIRYPTAESDLVHRVVLRADHDVAALQVLRYAASST